MNPASSRSPRRPAILLALLLAACSAQPPMPALHTAMPATWGSTGSWAQAPAPVSMPVDGAWWKVFDDPELDRLQHALLLHNQSLAAQLAIHEQAQAALEQARAAEYPSLSTQVGGSRGAAAGAGVGARNQVSAQLSASWEPDLWGRVRLQVEQGRAQLRASADTLRATRLSLQASLAQSYLQLRVVDAQSALAERTVRDYAQALQLTLHRLQGGVATDADVAQARTQLLQAQTARTDLEVTRKQLLDAIAVLSGAPAPRFALAAGQALPRLPRIPAGIPAQLLLRRPDLAAAQQQVQAANAQIGIAERAWLPALTLGASGGSQASALAGLLRAPSLYWSLGPSLAATLFDGGLRSAQLASSRAAYRQVVAQYRQAVLQAMQQVEDNLGAQRILRAEALQQAQLVQAAELSLRLVLSQYKAGTVSYLNVINAQTAATSARNGVLALRQRRYAAAVGLIAALGGAWSDGRGPGVADSSARPPGP